MAQRFGGKYSPPQGQRPAGPQGTQPGGSAPLGRPAPRRSRVGARVNLLFLLPLPLIWRAFTSEPLGMATTLVALGLLLLAAWMTREGLTAQDAYDARRVAKRPALPRKLIGAALMGLGLAVAGWSGFGMLNAVLLGAMGSALHVLSFGLDPLSDKGMDGIDSFQTGRVARAVDEAEAHLATMLDAARRAGDRHVVDRVQAFQEVVRQMLRTVQDDPRDLTGARRYIGVYLMGARDATVKFADLYTRTRDAGARQQYLDLLGDLEGNFTEKTRRLMLNDHSDLTVEIEVLRDRLQRDGLRPDG